MPDKSTSNTTNVASGGNPNANAPAPIKALTEALNNMDVDGVADTDGRSSPPAVEIIPGSPEPGHPLPNLPDHCTVLQVSDLNWYTSDADLIEAAKAANVEITHHDITFLEHKCNGKNKGIAFISCHSSGAVVRLLHWFETHEFQGKKVSTNIPTNVHGKSLVPPPTHDKDKDNAHKYREPPTRSPLPFLPTNSHGGVNFNRVPLHHRQQMQQMQQAGFLSPATHGKGRGGRKENPAHNHNQSVQAYFAHELQGWPQASDEHRAPLRV
ncbi:uncharacterized protein LOC62_06G007966 [Vanrija pseudolonga]|uniref:RRM domain-containing protein n=1 Tax=Vanrija pseudolonga TaxID=143232 RepID=A0AAF1BPU2_9TREE|nr:hypothetical protein LOC62_06G007966 [Vanrija pseudolonga]